MNTKNETQKKEAIRLALLYPGMFLGLVVILGAIASSDAGKFTPHDLDNAVRGMTALSTLAVSTAVLGYLKLKKCH